MGETLHAILEFSERKTDNFERISHWYFGKDYEIMSSCLPSFKEGWPKESVERYDDIGYNHFVCTLDEFDLFMDAFNRDHVVLEALDAAAMSLGKTFDVRILWYKL